MKTIKNNLFPLAILLVWTFIASAAVPFVLWLAVEILIIVLIVINVLGGRQEAPAKVSKDFPANQRNWLRRARKYWLGDMEAAGLVVEVPNRNPELPPTKFGPRLVAVTSSALGPVLTVTPSPGRQSVDDILAVQGNLESCWNAPIRMRKVGPAAVEITVEFESPLDGARDAVGADWMEDRSA